ncbi:TRAP transporter, DctM subunit [Desulfacinum hydrothermale DSM 13146]|uniref:TRAP transporter, DctM subunit n=1 Tax=Desulfacinum hydrothermale DSM 13146 TaxID=1121390 RepID=A0A1W1X0Q1_9BACT|nr:TRAP transporter large permease [Desulfacinum hydrothermale]SMC17350.1 TRAP transporter, DctM subunit [Desulfacinum hydrothermale DSM 13146]
MDAAFWLFFLFVVLLFFGIPIAVALGGVAIFMIWQFNLGIPVISSNFYAGIAKYPLLAIPFFILAGMILERCGVSQRLVNLASLLVGSIPGGLAIVAVLVCVFFGGVSGSGPADAAAMGAVLIPAMARKNYDKEFSAALIAAGGSTAIVVPPSIAFILYGVITTTSVPALFAAGVFPGILAGLSLILPAYWISKRRGYMGAERGNLGELWAAFKDAFWGLMAPLVILGGIYGGICTATEAAVVAVFYGMVLGFGVYRTLDLKAFYQILVDAALSSAVVLLIVALAGLYSWAGATLGVMERIAGALLTLSHNQWVVLAMVNGLILVAGMLLDAISIYYVFLPILLPIVAHFGWDPLWFGVVMTLNLAIGQFTPPVAVNLYVTTNLAGTPLEKTSAAALPFIAAMAAALILVILFPSLSLYLPKLWGLY